MKVQYDPQFYVFYKKLDVRIRHKFDKQIELFKKSPQEKSFDNHLLQDDWEGFRSIDITADYRAIYEEIDNGDELVAYFVAIGTHKELFQK